MNSSPTFNDTNITNIIKAFRLRWVQYILRSSRGCRTKDLR